MTRPLLVGTSLKMYLGHARTMAWCAAVADLARRHEAVTSGEVELLVLPSFLSVPGALEVLTPAGVAVGGQDLSWAAEGPYTGEVSGAQLRELGCRYAEVGHAERRSLLGEDDDVVARKVSAALRAGLEPVVCVGEVLRGDVAGAADSCRAELDAVLGPARRDGALVPLTVAYEPRWAIGAPQPASPEHVTGVVAGLRTYLAADPATAGSRVLYGGSAGPGLLARLGGGVDGLFLGRLAHDPAGLAAVLDEALSLRR